MSPDLWSVRTLVVRIEPSAPHLFSPSTRNNESTPRESFDPEMALKEAKKLRGRAGQELALARLLHRPVLDCRHGTNGVKQPRL